MSINDHSEWYKNTNPFRLSCTLSTAIPAIVHFYCFCLWIMDWKLELCDFPSLPIYHCSSFFAFFSSWFLVVAIAIWLLGAHWRTLSHSISRFNLHQRLQTWLGCRENKEKGFSSHAHFNCREIKLHLHSSGENLWL